MTAVDISMLQPGDVYSAAYLYSQQEKIEIERPTVDDVLVGHGHEDAADTVAQDGHHRVVGQLGGCRGRCHCGLRRSGSSLELSVRLFVVELDYVVSCSFLIGHVEEALRSR